MNKIRVTLALVSIMAVVTACAVHPKIESPLSTPRFVSPLGAQQLTSPIPTPLPTPKLNMPIYTGDAEVAGSGPAGLPIRLYEIGATGKELGDGVIGQDGSFKVKLKIPVQAGQRVGLALGDLKGTPFTFDALKDQAIINLPEIGLLFADVTVQPKP